MFKKLSIALIGSALAFSVAGCGSAETSSEGSSSASATAEEKRADAGLVRYISEEDPEQDVKTFSSDNFLMVGVDAKFTITSYGNTESLDLDGEVTRPAEGEVFHLIGFDYNPTTQPVEFSINVAGKETPVPTGMTAGGMFLVSAAEDADISVETFTGDDKGIVDMNVNREEAVRQSIDAKTAERSTRTAEVWYKNWQATIDDPNLQGQGGVSPYSLTVSTTVQEALRVGSVEEKGWAADGSAFIVVTTSHVEYEMEKHGSAGLDGFTMILTDSNGTTYAAESNEDDTEFLFTVPLADDEFTLHAEVSTGITMTGNPVAEVNGLVTSKASVSF